MTRPSSLKMKWSFVILIVFACVDLPCAFGAVLGIDLGGEFVKVSNVHATPNTISLCTLQYSTVLLALCAFGVFARGNHN